MIAGSFSDGLVSSGPAEEHREALMLYGQFVGDWETETTEWLSDGSTTCSRWDVRFQWVLEGRAVQDLWITPPRTGAGIAWTAPGNRYSTTLRIYDPKIDAWHIIWANPPTATVVRQLGRRVGEEIIQIGGLDQDGMLSRWVYRDITQSRFRWCNERSADNGATWRLLQEMHAVRLR
jgi:hypothetical protein